MNIVFNRENRITQNVIYIWDGQYILFKFDDGHEIHIDKTLNIYNLKLLQTFRNGGKDRWNDDYSEIWFVRRNDKYIFGVTGKEYIVRSILTISKDDCEAIIDVILAIWLSQ